MALITPGQAADLTGKHRSTIIRAIESGRLSATRDELGHHLIDPAELERAYGTLRSPDERDASRDDAEEQDATPAYVAALSREVELLREMLERERSQYDRDRRGWDDERTFMRGMLERHTEQVKMLTDQREERDRRTEQSRSFLARWLRRP
jgi:excisionase family DNA binding protein